MRQRQKEHSSILYNCYGDCYAAGDEITFSGVLGQPLVNEALGRCLARISQLFYGRGIIPCLKPFCDR